MEKSHSNQNDQKITKRYFTYQELSDHISININTLYSLVHQNKIPYLRLNSRLVRFDINEINQWLNNCNSTTSNH